MKRDERKFVFLVKMFQKHGTVRWIISCGRIFLDFSFESSESYCVFNYLHDSNSIFRAAGIISEGVFDGTVLETSKFASPRKGGSAPGIKLSQNVLRENGSGPHFFPTCS